MNAYIALGYACNHHCIFCPCGKDEDKRNMPNISTDKFKEYIDKICNTGNINSITVSGGEPTLQKNFKEILDILSETNLHVGILTNGDYLSRPDIFQYVIEHANPKQVHFTTALHSHIPNVHDSITQVIGSYQRSVSVLQKLMHLNYKVNIKHIIHRESYLYLSDYLKTMMQLFPLSNVGFIVCGMDYCGMDTETIKRTQVSFSELSPFLQKMLNYFEQNNTNNRFLTITDLPLCSVDPYYWKYFSYAQKESLSAYASPITKNQDISDIKFNVESDCNTFCKECSVCLVKDVCPGMWRSAWKLFGENAVKAVK